MSKRDVRILSRPLALGFPNEWYEIACEGHFWLEWRLAAFLNLIDDLGIRRDQPWRGLDIGCGNGIVRMQIERHCAWSVDGADLNEEALRLNRAERGETFFYNIHDRNEELAEAYNFIILFDVLEHIEEAGRFLDSVLFHLRPGGWLFINVPALEALRSAYDQAAGHVRRYDKAMMTRELAAHPLDLRDLRYWGLSLLPLLLLRTLVTARRRSTREIIQRGFEPPSPWINQLLKMIMKIEARLVHRPVLGTSLLATAVKR